MKTFLIGCFLLTVQFSFGQTNNFAPIGAKWHYDANQDEDCIIGDCDYTIVESVKDTMINGINSRKLVSKMILNNIIVIEDEFYVYEDVGKVYIYDNCSEEFNIIYNFNLHENDTLVIKDTSFCGFWPVVSEIEEFGCFKSIVDSTDQIEISAIELSRYFVKQLPLVDLSCIDSWFFNNTEIIERIGNLGRFPYGESANIIPETGCCNEELLCYQDDEITYSTLAFNCDLITSIDLIETYNLSSAQFSVKNKVITLIIPNELLHSKLHLITLSGNKIFFTILYDNLINIDLSIYPGGIYLLALNKDEYNENFKIILF